MVGFGTKAGLMPFHSWLPRAHPLAPSHLSALMSGVMIKVALYGLIRVLFVWLGVTHAWVGMLLLALGGSLGAGGRRLRALSARAQAAAGVPLHREHRHHRARVWAPRCSSAATGRRPGPASLWRPPCSTCSITLCSRACCSWAPGAIDRAVHGLGLDRLGGLLRRMPWTGERFLDRRHGHRRSAAAERVRLRVADAAVAGARRHRGRRGGGCRGVARGFGAGSACGRARSPLAALAMTAALAVLCFAKVVGLVLLGPPRRAGVRGGARGVASP